MVEDDLSQVNPELYADLPPEQREEAIHNLHRYLDAIVRLHDRLKAEGKLDSAFWEIRKEKRKRKHQ